MHTLLIIDREFPVIQDHTTALSQRGYNVLQVNDINAALDVMVKENVAIIILDSYFVKRKGIAIIQKFRRLKKYEKIPMIILSEEGNGKDLLQEMDVVNCTVISKPCPFERLYQSINSLIYSAGTDSSPFDSAAEFYDKNDYPYNIPLLLAGRKSRHLDSALNFLAERFANVYFEDNPQKFDQVIKEKNVKLLIIEANSLQDEYFAFIQTIPYHNAYIGMPVIAISGIRREMEDESGQNLFNLDKVVGFPFTHGLLLRTILEVMELQNIRKKLKQSMQKIRYAIEENKDKERKDILTLRHELENVKRKNLELIQYRFKSYDDDSLAVIAGNHQKAARLASRISEIKKSYVNFNIELVKAERKVSNKISMLNQIQASLKML